MATLVVSVLTSAVGGWASAAQAAAPQSTPTNEHHDWWCVAVDTTNVGYCQGDPLPERLPGL
jgi:invasion protein IalB